MNKRLTLTGIRVADLGTRPSTAWCSRLLADYGAEVMCVEPGDGHPLRRVGPFAGGESVPARYFLAGKTRVSEANAHEVVSAAHIVITDALPGGSWDCARIRGINDRALVCAITAYGQMGEFAYWPGNDLTANAMSGWASVNGLNGREPLKASGYQASYQCGTLAYGALLCALMEQLAGARVGGVIDIAERDVLVSTAAPAPLRFQYSGFVWPRKELLDVNEGPVPVADGYFALTISRPIFWKKAMRILGLPDLAEDEELQQAGLRPKLKERFAHRVSQALSTWTRMDLFAALGEQRVIAGPVLTMAELGDNAQFESRGFLRTMSDGTRVPGPFARMDKSGWRGDGDDPLPAQIDPQPVRAGADGEGPLAGFRGVVLTQAWAGTYATQLLALLGAEVIQVETRRRLDSWRGTYQNPIPKGLRDIPSAQHAWNCSPLYNCVNLSKQCVTLDLSVEEGVSVFRDLIAHADFVAENFSPRVMGNLGIDYETLRTLKPDLVMASLSAYGATGPWAGVPGIGGTIEPSSGMSALLGYAGEHPLNSGQMYPDPVAGLCGFAAIALALLHRDRTGEGQYIDLSMQEANFTFIGDAWLEYELTGEVPGPRGNGHPLHAPHGIYPSAGEDQWIAISAEDDQQWAALCDVLDCGDPSLGRAARKERENEIDEIVATATRRQPRSALSRRLVERGVVAAPVLNAQEVAEDAALRQRGHMVKVAHPEAGEAWQSGFPALFDTPLGPVRPAPLQGEHSYLVFHTLLGMGSQRYQQLVDLEMTGTGKVSKSTVANQA